MAFSRDHGLCVGIVVLVVDASGGESLHPDIFCRRKSCAGDVRADVLRQVTTWGAVCAAPHRCNSSASRKTELIGITRRLLRVFGVPNCPLENVSETSMFPRRKSSRVHLSARISPIRMPVSTAVNTMVRHGSGSLVSKVWICAGSNDIRSLLDTRSPIWMPWAGLVSRYPCSTAVRSTFASVTRMLCIVEPEYPSPLKLRRACWIAALFRSHNRKEPSAGNTYLSRLNW